MPYPPELKELIKTVERTRPERLASKKQGEEFPMMSLAERQEMLRYHPDYREEGRRALALGPNKGYRIPHEFADLLEARSRVEPGTVDLSSAERLDDMPDAPG